MSLYGLTIGIVLTLVWHFFSKNNTVIPKKHEDIFIIFLYLAMLTGARIYHVAGEWPYYSRHLVQILNLRAGGLGIYGAIIAAAVSLAGYSRIFHLSFIKLTNLFIPWTPLAQAVGRWGNFFNTEGFGLPTYSVFGQYIPAALRPFQFQSYSRFHPVWLYESLLDLVLFFVLRRFSRRPLPVYLIGYGLIRFFTEFFRFDTWVVGQFKIAQIISLLFFFLGLILFFHPPASPNRL